MRSDESLQGQWWYHCFIGKEAELQRGKGIYAKSHSQEEVEPGCELSLVEGRAIGFVPPHDAIHEAG